MIAMGILTGADTVRAHIPALQTSRGTLGLAAAVVASIAGTSGFLALVDRYFYEWLPDGPIVVMTIGFLILARFFSQREGYQARYGSLAYAKATVAFGVPGLGIIFASIAHLGYMAGPLIPDVPWKPVLQAIGWLAIIIGGLLWWRAVNALGADYLAMLYVYLPQDRRVIRSGLFGVIRHPVYAAAIHFSLGLACVRAGWYSLIVALVVPLFLLGWIVLVEEKELLAQVPDYGAYRTAVPAFAPRPRDLGKYWRYLLLGT